MKLYEITYGTVFASCLQHWEFIQKASKRAKERTEPSARASRSCHTLARPRGHVSPRFREANSHEWSLRVKVKAYVAVDLGPK